MCVHGCVAAGRACFGVKGEEGVRGNHCADDNNNFTNKRETQQESNNNSGVIKVRHCRNLFHCVEEETNMAASCCS